MSTAESGSRSWQLWCAHSALPFMILVAVGGFLIPGWLPPIHPSLSAGQIASMFQERQINIRIGMTLLALSAPLAWSFAAAIYGQMKRIEGDSHPLATVQMATATGTAVPLLLAAYLWLALAYRPELTPPAVIQLLNDFSWFCFIAMFAPATLQVLVVGLCILSDRRSATLYPRWTGFASLWIAVLFLPGALIPFFKTGPFTWAGLIGFWLPATAFFAWYILLWLTTVRAIKRT